MADIGTLVELAGGPLRMGTDGPFGYPQDGEQPSHTIDVGPFAISTTAVTADEFAAFVDATGHVTQAETDGCRSSSPGYFLSPSKTPQALSVPSGGGKCLGPRGAIRRDPRVTS